VKEAVRLALDNPKVNGYGPALGLDEAKEAIAKRYANRFATKFDAKDIFITSGCSHALQMAISGAVSEGEALLLPKPGFSIYHTITEHFGINGIDYPLLPDNNWEIDLKKVEALFKQHRPVAWLINNPSNPCGSVYRKDHLRACIDMAKRYKILIIADEIYEDIVFEGHQYHPMASLSLEHPIVTCSGLAKRYMVPGWRLGWIALHDPLNRVEELRGAFFNLAGLILGPCTLIQAALPFIFDNVPEEHYRSVNTILEGNAQVIVEAFRNTLCDAKVKLLAPQGTLYMMLQLPEGTDDVKWCQDLLAEENVLLLPGTVPNYLLCDFVDFQNARVCQNCLLRASQRSRRSRSKTAKVLH
jgi:tyrosine aminotransferase